MPSTPKDVLDALSKLDESDQTVVKDYIAALESTIAELKGADPSEDEPSTAVDDSNFPPLYESGEDYDTQSDRKMRASDLAAEGKLDEALEQYTAAILAAPPSALLYANRATVLLKLDQYAAAARDCDEALAMNPDSGKALRVRGKARKAMGEWEAALKDLSQAQQIDFDEGTVDDLKVCTEKHVEAEKARASCKVEEKKEEKACRRKFARHEKNRPRKSKLREISRRYGRHARNGRDGWHARNGRHATWFYGSSHERSRTCGSYAKPEGHRSVFGTHEWTRRSDGFDEQSSEVAGAHDGPRGWTCLSKALGQIWYGWRNARWHGRRNVRWKR
jgi:suppressor of tumorigenicity protein 13